jgi:hypothetical protein
MAVITVGVGRDFLNAQDAFDSIPSGPFTEPWVVVVYADAVGENVNLSSLEPTNTNRLTIRGDLKSRGELSSNGNQITVPPYTVIDQMNFWGGLRIGDATTIDDTWIRDGLVGIELVGPTTQTIRIQNVAVSGCFRGIVMNDVSDLLINHTSVETTDTHYPDYESVRSAVDLRSITSLTLKNSAISMNSIGWPRYTLIIDEGTVSASDEIDYSCFHVDGDAALLGFIDSGGDLTTYRDVADFKSLVSPSPDNLFEDPKFATAALGVNNLSPLMNAADTTGLFSISKDLKSNPRFDKATIGPYEIDSILTDAVPTKIIELLTGMSTTPVNEVVLGDGGVMGSSDFERKGHEVGENTLETPALTISVRPTGPHGLRTFQEHVAQTDVAHCVTIRAIDAEALYGHTTTVHDYKEIGLASDGVLLFKRNTGQIPFDPLLSLDTQINIAYAIQ